MVARKRDYRQEYAARKAKAAERGETVRQYKRSVAVERRNAARERARREKRRASQRASYQRLKESAARNGRTVTQERRARREAREATFGEGASRQEILRHFHVRSMQEFEQMRNANLEYHLSLEVEEQLQRSEKKRSTKKSRDRATRAKNYVQMINHYDTSRDVEGDYSLDRMGYVITFYKAIVSPRTNYDAYIGAKQDGKMTPEILKWQGSYIGEYATSKEHVGDAFLDYVDYIGRDDYSVQQLFRARYGVVYF